MSRQQNESRISKWKEYKKEYGNDLRREFLNLEHYVFFYGKKIEQSKKRLP